MRGLTDLEEPTEEHKARWSAEIAQREFHRDRNTEKLRIALRAIIQAYRRAPKPSRRSAS